MALKDGLRKHAATAVSAVRKLGDPAAPSLNEPGWCVDDDGNLYILGVKIPHHGVDLEDIQRGYQALLDDIDRRPWTVTFQGTTPVGENPPPSYTPRDVVVAVEATAAAPLMLMKPLRENIQLDVSTAGRRPCLTVMVPLVNGQARMEIMHNAPLWPYAFYMRDYPYQDGARTGWTRGLLDPTNSP